MRHEPLEPGAVRLGSATVEQAREAVSSWRAELTAALEPYQTHRWSGSLAPPTLQLDDVSDIPFLVGVPGVEQYQHRARLRARTGDFFAARTDPSEGYETYCRDRLGLGSPELLLPQHGENRLRVAEACRQGPTFDALVRSARERGGLHIHPYMGIEAVWQLADHIARDAKTPVEVVAPPPPVTWIANDKARFEDLVALVIGDGWLVESRRSSRPEELSRALLRLAREHRRVGLKRLRCASAMGNRVIDAEDLGHAEDADRIVHDFLRSTEWNGVEEVLVVVWEDTELSPSTQLWIPPRGLGEPWLDGIYEQILEGPEKVFVGSRPSHLPMPLQQRLGEAALTLGVALQELGYCGRCSFDHLVLGDPEQEPEACALRFTECNGRWGGTSSPMSLMDRLDVGARAGIRPPYRAQDFVDERLVGTSFGELLRAVGDAAYDRTTGGGHFAFYNVGPLAESGKLDVIAWGDSQAEAERALEEELPGLLGLL